MDCNNVISCSAVSEGFSRRTARQARRRSRRGQFLLSKNGVYLIDRSRKIRSFRFIPWAQILTRLES